MATARGHTPRGVSRSGDSGKRYDQLSEVVAKHVREAIMVGELRAPAFIRTERLADQLGVSPTPVREALMILHSEGSIRWEPRRGFRVVPLTSQDVSDLFDVQAYIAGELAARAASTLPDDEIPRLRLIQTKLEKAARRGQAQLVDQYNHEIHRTINKVSESARMTMLLGMLVKYVPLGFFGTIAGWADASVHDHTAIFTALEDSDEEAARKAMSDHIRHTGTLLVRHLEARGILDDGGPA